jgi:hypothetical protein
MMHRPLAFARSFAVPITAVLTLVLGSSATLSAINSTPASAVTSGNDCGFGPGSTNHGYSEGLWCGTQLGVLGDWPSSNFYMSSAQYAAGSAMTHEEWEETNASGGQFIEMGLVDTNDSVHGWSNPCGSCTAYQIFWADQSASTYYFHWLANISPGAGTYDYGITSNNNGTDHWTIGLDDVAVGTSVDQVTSTGFASITGMEYLAGAGYVLNPSDYSDTFNQYLQEDVGGTWTTKPWSGWINTAACGSPQPPYYANGYCTNGVSYSNSEWSSNAPA